ncbi:MAG: hypothetical protein A3J24_03525 [Deltaproteobacteria bacterium RIFCSPLOWO2_02_FULL_53_8]|nr:MAG: hypothetical protein A3J24_03525 [Deltaproteobacteria bacterium RIFCSPLOWO2_02_FULL_53_8]
MRRFVAALLLTVFLSLLSLPSHAERLKEAAVDYTADSVMESGGIKTSSKVYRSGKLARIDQMTDGAIDQTLILRGEGKKVIVLMPLMQMYMEVEADALGSALYDPDEMDYTLSFEGRETISGVSTARHRMTALAKDGKRFEGRLWLTQEDIMFKIEATSTATVKGKPERVTMELSNLKTGPLRRSLFEVPAGYTKMKAIGDNGRKDKVK